MTEPDPRELCVFDGTLIETVLLVFALVLGAAIVLGVLASPLVLVLLGRL